MLLLDEPLAALDAHTRRRCAAELQELLHGSSLPTLLVTHDYEDAAALADDGRRARRRPAAPARDAGGVVARPARPFVASFTGANLLHGRVRGPADSDGLTAVRLEGGDRVYSTDAAEGEVGVVVYPWDVSLGQVPAEGSALNLLSGEVASVVQVGNRLRVRIGPLTAEVTAASAERLALEPGRTAFASFKATATRLVALS